MSQTEITILQTLLTFISALAGSVGMWTFLDKRAAKKDYQAKLLMGLAHDRITYLGERFIERGYITKDEYENLYDYLYVPYLEMCGNGSAKRIMSEVEKLPIRNSKNPQTQGD